MKTKHFRGLCDNGTLEEDIPDELNTLSVIIVLSTLICCVLCLCVYSCYEEGELDGPIAFAKKHADASTALKIITQVLISACSIIGSLALSDSFGHSAFDNGILAITMGVVAVLLTCCKLVWAFGAIEKKDFDSQDSAAVLACTIFGATMTDATFDIFQGIAAVRNEEYTALSASILITATWLGVGEEIIEGTFEILSTVIVDGCGECTDSHPFVTKIIYYIMIVSAIVELCMGIYLFSTFSDAVYVGVGIGIQSLWLLFATLWFCWIGFYDFFN